MIIRPTKPENIISLMSVTFKFSTVGHDIFVTEHFRVPLMGTKDENLEPEHHLPCTWTGNSQMQTEAVNSMLWRT